jgi:replicative DNA helicase
MNPVTDSPLFSREAEQSVLGGLFVSPVSFAEVAATVNASDFADYGHRLIFAAMQALAAKLTPIDLVTVSEWLESQGHCPEPVSLAYLITLARDTPSAANVLAYAGLVSSYSQRRRLLALADKMAIWAREERDPAITIARVQKALESALQGLTVMGLRPLSALLPEVIADLDERAHRTQALLGRKTGLPDLDRVLDGLCAGRLYIVAGRPSSGKSVLGLQVAREAVREGKNVAFFSLEMPETEVVHRLMAADIPLALEKIQSARMSDHEWNALAHAAERLAPIGLWIDATSAMTISELLSRARRLHRQAPLGLVVVDYLGLIDGDRGGNSEYSNRVQEISSITRALKQLAKELDCPVVALAQLNRKLEERADKRPILSDLRESGAIEQDADVVLMVYRDELHNPESLDQDCAELHVRKNRGGKIGMIPALFQGEHCQFLPLAGPLPSHEAPAPDPPRRRKFSDQGKR